MDGTKKEIENDNIPIRCHHCGHEWDYGGNSEYYASCPVCKYRVNINKHRCDKDQEEIKWRKKSKN